MTPTERIAELSRRLCMGPPPKRLCDAAARQRWVDIADANRRGESDAQIAERLGCTRELVRRVLSMPVSEIIAARKRLGGDP